MNKERPCLDKSFSVDGSDRSLTCDIVWPGSRVMLFQYENKEDYEQALNSDWKCLITSNPDLTPNELSGYLKEE